MKWLLILSLGFNAFLGYRLLQAPTTKTVIEEKVLVKRSKPTVVEKKVYVEVPLSKAGAKSQEGTEAPRFVDYDEKDMEDMVTKVTQDREDYLNSTLNLTPQDHEKIQAVKERFNKRYMEIIPVEQYGDLSIEQRRQLLDLESERDMEFENVMGAKKWEQFQKYRDSYNRKMFNNQANGQGIILPMEI